VTHPSPAPARAGLRRRRRRIPAGAPADDAVRRCKLARNAKNLQQAVCALRDPTEKEPSGPESPGSPANSNVQISAPGLRSTNIQANNAQAKEAPTSLASAVAREKSLGAEHPDGPSPNLSKTLAKVLAESSTLPSIGWTAESAQPVRAGRQQQLSDSKTTEKIDNR